MFEQVQDRGVGFLPRRRRRAHADGRAGAAAGARRRTQGGSEGGARHGGGHMGRRHHLPQCRARQAEGQGVQINRLRSGGMWIINEFSVAGTPYEGTGIWGYDRASGRYSGIWTDNNDQKIRLDDGRWDPATRTMTWSADVAQPDGRHARYLFTEEFKGDTRLFNMVALTRKGEVPLVSMVFTRRKG
jgi:hypothetical protein